MATSQISSTVTKADGSFIVGITVTARLRPDQGFRISDSSEIAELVSTTTDSSGHWVLTLERNSNIDPPNSYYIIQESIPESLGGTRSFNVLVGSSNALLHDALVTPISSPADMLTVSNSALNTLDTKVVHLAGPENITGIKAFNAGFSVGDGQNIAFGATTGTEIGGAGSLLALYGSTPVAQASRAGQLTDNSGGTSGGNTVAAVTDNASAANAIATLLAKINALELIIHNLGASA